MQVIKNLLSNSFKFTEKGKITLSIESLGIVRNKVSMVFRVKDTGIGIPKDKQDSIFESFIQADPETSIRYGGTGLGLAISKKLLKVQNSQLKVESEPGNGALFSFQITFRVSNRLSVYEPEMIKELPNFEPLKIKVLIAEDNKMNVLILKKFFSKWKVDYSIADNGEEVLKLMESSEEVFDLILMDLQMPLLNGYETTKIIRNFADPVIANIPIVALTACAQTDTRIRTEKYEMNGFIGKPFNPEQLYNVLKMFSCPKPKKKGDNSI